MKRSFFLAAAAVVLALVLAACGAKATAGGTSASASGGGKTTVSTMNISGTGTVLVSTSGLPLYTNNLDAKGKVLCTGACTTVWKPLTISSGSPSGTTAAGTLGTVLLSNGTKQVTLNGKPLYTFFQDKAGQATGNGAQDSFGGHNFTWSLVMVGGNSGSTGVSGGGSGGGIYGGGSSGSSGASGGGGIGGY